MTFVSIYYSSSDTAMKEVAPFSLKAATHMIAEDGTGRENKRERGGGGRWRAMCDGGLSRCLLLGKEKT